MKFTQTMPHRAKGFTLLEVLIASAIFALIGFAAFSMLFSAQQSQEILEEQSTRLFQIQKAMMFMFRDFGQVAKRTYRNEFGDTEFAMKGESDQSGERSYVEFVRHGWRNPLSLPRSSMQHIRYRWEDNQLIREHWNYLDLAPGAKPFQTILLEEVESISFRFLTRKEWIQSWPENETDKTGIPRAVMVTINISDFGTIVRTFLITG